MPKLPPIARGIADNGYPEAFGVYPWRFGNDLNGNPIYVTGKNQDGWINVFALARRDGVNYFRYGFNVESKRWCRIMASGAYDRTKPPIDESILDYAEQVSEQTSGSAPTKTEMQVLQHYNRPTEEQISSLTGGLKLDPTATISAAKLDELLKLEGQPPRAEDMELLARYRITLETGDAFSTYGVGDLVRSFENMLAESGDYTDIALACVTASNDPAFEKATITLDQFDRFVFTWPKAKLKQWYRQGAK